MSEQGASVPAERLQEQLEEIALTFWRSTTNSTSLFAALKSAYNLGVASERARALNDALEAVTAEHLTDPQNEEDEAYDRAIVDARQAIGRLFHPAAPPDGGSPQE
jgi:hypothetical protein